AGAWDWRLGAASSKPPTAPSAWKKTPRSDRVLSLNCRLLLNLYLPPLPLNMPNILIVDDETGIRDTLGGILADEDYSTSAAQSGEECLDLLRKDAFDVVLLDIWLPG